MRKLVPLVAVGALAWAPASHAAAPAVTVKATPAAGAAPLAVTLSASGDAATYAWSLGDGATATGAVVHHTYRAAGRYHAVVTATAAGESSRAAVDVTAYSLSLRGSSPAAFGKRLLFSGRIRPTVSGLAIVLREDGRVVGSARTGPAGRYKIRPRVSKPGSFQASAGRIESNLFSVRIRPDLEAKVVGSGVVRSRLAVVARVRPASAGQLRIQVFRNGHRLKDVVRSSPARIPLRTRKPQEYRVRVRVVATTGYTRPHRSLAATVFLPNLRMGSKGPSVQLLQSILRGQRYMLRGVDGRFGYDTYEAVLAFQKVHGLSRTGRVTAGVWRILQHSHTPKPRYRSPYLHYEVNKSRQYLFDVRGGKVVRIIHVSTGATGNTPVGTFHVYSKTPGYNAKGMYDSQYFIGGFAIHGYADVPPYPASHGCVRIPIWIAPILYASHPYGTTVYIYY